MGEALSILNETGRWRSRDVRYLEGPWTRLREEIPEFRKEEFRTQEDAPSNPYMQTVVRIPRTKYEQPIPVGVVSNSYTLAQHREVGEKCFSGIRAAGVDTNNLKCQVGLTELGEWMNLRIYFPDEFNYKGSDGETLGLRIECFNSVEGSSRLLLLLGWLRFVCSNGMVIGTTMEELRDIHNRHMDLNRIPEIVIRGLEFVQECRDQFRAWEELPVESQRLAPWVNEVLQSFWGKKAACRAFHICTSGFDVDFVNPFEKGHPTEKTVKRIERVPGAPDTAKSMYDVSQALSWIASRRPNPEERVAWQFQISKLLESL